MENIKLPSGRIIEPHYGKNVDKIQPLLARKDGNIPSEADIRLLGIQHYKTNPEIANNYWDTSTLLATKGKNIKVILPYETGSRQLTKAARFGLCLINPQEGKKLVNYGVNLDVEGENRWEQLDGNGVYTLQREGLILNRDLTEAEAMKHGLLLTKLGHPDFVDGKFKRSADEVAEIIGKTFELGKNEHSYDTMMGQYIDGVSKKGVLKVCYVGRLDIGARSYARARLDNNDGRVAFDSVRDAISDAVGVGAKKQLASLEEAVNTEKFPVNEIHTALKELDGLKELTYVPIEQILEAGKGVVPEFAWSEFEKRIQAQYESQ